MRPEKSQTENIFSKAAQTEIFSRGANPGLRLLVGINESYDSSSTQAPGAPPNLSIRFSIPAYAIGGSTAFRGTREYVSSQTASGPFRLILPGSYEDRGRLFLKKAYALSSVRELVFKHYRREPRLLEGQAQKLDLRLVLGSALEPAVPRGGLR